MKKDAKSVAQNKEQADVTPTLLLKPYFFGASVIGPLHVQLNIPCQDACSFEVITSDFVIAAIADGLGSASKSDTGARLVVEAAVKTVKEAIDCRRGNHLDICETARNAAIAARNSLEEKAMIERCSLRDLACTVIVIVAHKDNISVAQIGDGAVVAKIDDDLRLISAPAESEYLNEVTPITSKDWEKSLQVSPQVSGVKCVAAFTDGLQRAALLKDQDGLKPFEGFLEPIFSYAQELDDLKQGEQDIKDLLASHKLSAHSEDDKTLIIGVFGKGDID